jgi:2,4-dienoyl-CoA reductase-like NADH-dependent reductase (Old Yellow Enzyme family)
MSFSRVEILLFNEENEKFFIKMDLFINMLIHPSSQVFGSFKYKLLADLEIELKRLMIPLPISHNLEILKDSLQIDDIIVANRLSIQPMEGFDAKLDGSPSELTFRRYMRYAKGGVGLIWFEATALSNDCCSNAHQLILSEDNVNEFKKFTTLIRTECNNTLEVLGFRHPCILILQLNHSGKYTKRKGKKYPIKTYHATNLDEISRTSQNDEIILTDEELNDIEELWIQKAILAREAGFDGVDIKACHGYLISDLFSAHTRQDSIYGGEDFDNRSRFYLNIINKLQNKFRKETDFIITSRLGVYDGNPYPIGFGVKHMRNEKFPATIELSEPIELINKLSSQGIKMINISTGNPHQQPHITRPYDVPIKGGIFPKEHPLFSVYRIIYLTSVIKNLIPKDIKIIGSGYSYFRQYAANLASGVIEKSMADICGFGRMAFANPDFAKQIFQEGKINKQKSCISCSKCSQLMREGKKTGCAVRDPYYIGSV